MTWDLKKVQQSSAKLKVMKLSKVLLVSFIALFFTVLDVAVDTSDRTSIISVEQLASTAKSYLHNVSNNVAIAYNNVKDDIMRANYNTNMNNGKELAFNMQDQYHDFDDWISVSLDSEKKPAGMISASPHFVVDGALGC